MMMIMGTSVIIATLEKLYPYNKGQRLFRKYFFTDFAWYTIFLSYVMGVVIFRWVIPGIDSLGWIERPTFLSDWPVWVQILVFVVSHDLWIYWWHRLQHNNRFLWRIHEAHHSAVEVDWVAGSRTHVLETLINQTVEYGPIILLGAHPLVALSKGVIDAVWGMYIHSNIGVRTGKLQYFINGPEMHRWHHSAEVHDINYSTKFAIWDWLFKTAYLPKHRVERYGLGGDTVFPDNVIAQQAFAFRKFEPVDEANDGSASHSEELGQGHA